MLDEYGQAIVDDMNDPKLIDERFETDPESFDPDPLQTDREEWEV